jgi:hypothetical protein
MESWFCIWDDLLGLFAIARVANLNNGLNLVQTRSSNKTLTIIFAYENPKIKTIQ